MRMNWGSGPVLADGWINLDPDARLAGVVQARSTRDLADGSFDGIVANHSLQCLPAVYLDSAVADFARLLRVGGRLRVLVPDVLAAFRAYEDNDATWPGFVAIGEPWEIDRKFAHYLTWGGQNRSCFTATTLRDLLYRNGFDAWAYRADNEEAEWEWLRALDSREGESLIVEVVKT